MNEGNELDYSFDSAYDEVIKANCKLKDVSDSPVILLDAII